ncbi:MAG TPA: replicative DNA helicase [Dehalococcoidia bacterium]|nr:replicative DNA helicase [Dehalococcoidia bacterium]
MYGEKLPPHDVDAEGAVIGSLLIDGSAVYKVAPLLQPSDFYLEQNQWLYEACLALYERNEAINQITVAQELARRGRLEACGGAAYLSHLISICPTPLDIEHYAQIVYRLSVMRGLIRAADEIARVGYEAGPDVSASLSRAEDILFKLRHGQGSRDFTHIRQVLDKYFETAPLAPGEEEYARAGMPGLLSNFVGLDEFLGGFQRSDLIIVAGRPSMGKTSFALSVARNVAVEQKACVAMFSLEMARESVVMRLLSSESGVNSRRVRFGLHTEDEERRIMEAIGVLAESQIYIDDSPQLRVAEMRSKARRLHFERGIDLIIIDYLQLMQGEGMRGENRVQEISYISRSLKALARELNVPVLAVSQLSRAVEWRASHIPQLSDLRESGSIEQDADVVLFVYRDEYYHSEEEWESLHPDKEYPREEADIIIAKNRNGPTGQVKLRFRHSLATFYNFEYPISSEEPSLL